MTADLTQPSARADRDHLADRTDVLDKVGVLRCLPDDVHATTDMAASFYEVDAATIRQLVNRNREELDDDGYDVISRAEVSDKLSLTPDELGMPRTAGSLALYPRRAILRIGMLLRDSPVARKVRDYLLNTEQTAHDIDPRHVASMLTRADLARMVLEAEEEKSVLAAALESAAPAIAYHDRHIADNDDLILIEVWAAWFGLTKPQAFNLLRDKNIIFRKTIGQRWSKKANAVVEEYEYRPRAGRITFEWFELRPQHNAPRHHNNQVRQTLYVKAFFADELGRKCGLERISAEQQS